MPITGTGVSRPRPVRGLWVLLAFGAVVTLLGLMAPLFLLVLYDQVLPAGDGAGLAALLLLALGVLAVMGGMDALRLRLSARLGAALADGLQSRLWQVPGESLPKGLSEARLDSAISAISRPLSGPLAVAVTDLVWTPVLLLAVVWVHPVLGGVAVAGGLALILGTVLLHRTGDAIPKAEAQMRSAQARLGLGPPGVSSGTDVAALRRARAQAIDGVRVQAEASGNALAFGRSLRLMLHASLLAAGAWLVMAGQIGTGAMLAVAILAMRALAPLDIVATQVGQLVAARDGWQTLRRVPGLLTDAPDTVDPAALPWLEPDLTEGLEIVDAAVLPPGAAGPALQRISLRLHPGAVLGVAGPPGAGKSLLGALAAGTVAPVAGAVLLGGVPLSRIPPARHAELIGHLPQRIAIAPGTVAQNVALARPGADRAEVGRAMRRAGLSAALTRLPDGAATHLAPDGTPLSASAIQRLGLARALLGCPALVVLDTPLSAIGPRSVAEAARLARDLAREGAMVMLIASEPEALAGCDRLLMLDHGLPTLAGPTDAVLAAHRAGTTAAPATLSPAGAA